MGDDPGGWEARTHRRFTEPVPVTVQLAVVFPDRAASVRTFQGVPLRVRSLGIDLSGTVPGSLRGWHRMASGSWWGLCDFTVRSRNGRLRLDLHQLVPAAALSPRHTGPDQ
ncbi:hypothetical protein [Actinocatenispora rupis]|uniref:hypothetical protein n=1 Tax=Actinocatenispora rupis TaxID=519421 RepID=UPI001945358D|nr:hypothetical protein [Actinocatenispora rupis]